MSVDATKEKWMQWVALTTTVLAVCTAISTLKGGGYSTRVQILTVQETNTWGYFQAKSIKQHIYEMQVDAFKLELIKPNTPESTTYIEGKIKAYEEAVGKYEKEKTELKSEAEKIGKDSGALKNHGGNFSMAAMFFQIGIMMSSVGALLKRRPLWIAGLLMGSIGMLYFANGFWLFF